MKRHLLTLLFVLTTAFAFGQTMTCSQPSLVTDADSVSILPPPIPQGWSALIVSAAMLLPNEIALASDDVQSYPPLGAVDPAHQTGTMELFLLPNAQPQGPVTVQWGKYVNGQWVPANNSVLITAMACALPPGVLWRGPIYSQTDSENTFHSGSLGTPWTMFSPELAVFVIEAGDSNMPPFIPKPGWTIPPNGFTQNSALEYKVITCPSDNETWMGDTGWTLHESGMWFAVETGGGNRKSQ